MIRSTKDFWAGVVYLFLGVAAVVIARDYAMGTALRMGPAYFPTLLGYLLAGIGLISILRAFWVTGPPIGAWAVRGLVLVVTSVVLFGLLVRRAGFLLALPLMVVVSGYASAHFRWSATLLLALGLTIFCGLVFLYGLGVPLPFLGSWFVS